MDPAASLANRALESEDWARERLALHAGSIFVVVVGPLATGLRIDATGRFESAELAGHVPDLTLTISSFAVPSFLANPTRWDEYVVSNGNPELATTLRELAQTLPWFIERAFSTALGSIVGLRVAEAGRRLLAMPEYIFARAGESAVSYVNDEAGLLAQGDEMRSFAAQCAVLAARVDTIAMRLDTLDRTIAASRRAAPIEAVAPSGGGER